MTTFPRGVDPSDLDSLLVAGICDCGVPLDVHEPLPPVEKWGGWTSQKMTPPEFRSGSSLTVERRLTDGQMRSRREMGGRLAPRPPAWSQPR